MDFIYLLFKLQKQDSSKYAGFSDWSKISFLYDQILWLSGLLNIHFNQLTPLSLFNIYIQCIFVNMAKASSGNLTIS